MTQSLRFKICYRDTAIKMSDIKNESKTKIIKTKSKARNIKRNNIMKKQRPLRCQHCPTHFKYESVLKNHLASAHPDIPIPETISQTSYEPWSTRTTGLTTTKTSITPSPCMHSTTPSNGLDPDLFSNTCNSYSPASPWMTTTQTSSFDGGEDEHIQNIVEFFPPQRPYNLLQSNLSYEDQLLRIKLYLLSD